MKLHHYLGPVRPNESARTTPPPSLDSRLRETAATEIDGRRFDGVDLELSPEAFDPDLSDDDLRHFADEMTAHRLTIGTLAVPVSSAQPRDDAAYVSAVRHACRIAQRLNDHGIRSYGVIRVTSPASLEDWDRDPRVTADRVASVFREAGIVASDHDQRLAVEGDTSRAGTHSWQTTLDLLEATAMPDVVGFHADLAATYLYLTGRNAPEDAMLGPDHSDAQFREAYQTLTAALRPWTFDFNLAQTDGTVPGRVAVDDPSGKLEPVECATFWLRDAERRDLQHIAWNGSGTHEDAAAITRALATLIAVENAV